MPDQPNPCPLCGGMTLTCPTGTGKLICETCSYLLDSSSLEEAITVHNSIKPKCRWIKRRYLGMIGTEYTRACDGKTNLIKEIYCSACGGEIEVAETKIS